MKRSDGILPRPGNATAVADAVARTKARRWRRLLLTNLYFGSLWQLTRILFDLGNDGIAVPNALTSILLLVQMLSWVCWTLSLLALGALIQKEKKAPTGGPDEFPAGKRPILWQAAVKVGFFSMLVAQLALLIMATDTRLSAVTGADISIYAGAVSAVGAFLFLNSD